MKGYAECTKTDNFTKLAGGRRWRRRRRKRRRSRRRSSKSNKSTVYWLSIHLEKG